MVKFVSKFQSHGINIGRVYLILVAISFIFFTILRALTEKKMWYLLTIPVDSSVHWVNLPM